MRELTVTIKFQQPCLGNTKTANGNMVFPRDNDENIVFMPSWHFANMRYAARVLNRYLREVRQIEWDPVVKADLHSESFYQRRYTRNERTRYVCHEAVKPGEFVELNCVVPQEISDDGFRELLELAGKYKGLSPYYKKDYGRFTVESIERRRDNSTEAH